MKARKKNWLDTALRAQQAKTLDQHYRVHEAQAAQEQAVQHESNSRQSLHSLAASWRQSRDSARLTKDLDGLYQRFHAQLRTEAADATIARLEHQRVLDSAEHHLQHHHAIQQALDRTVKRRDHRIAKELQAKERNAATEAWMLDRAGKKGKE